MARRLLFSYLFTNIQKNTCKCKKNGRALADITTKNKSEDAQEKLIKAVVTFDCGDCEDYKDCSNCRLWRL